MVTILGMVCCFSGTIFWGQYGERAILLSRLARRSLIKQITIRSSVPEEEYVLASVRWCGEKNILICILLGVLNLIEEQHSPNYIMIILAHKPGNMSIWHIPVV